MSSDNALEARARYKQEEYLRQAAQERLLRQLRPPTGAPEPSAGPRRRALASLDRVRAALATLASTG